jgi:hypothetical protein
MGQTENQVLDDNIRSVQLLLTDDPMLLPIVHLYTENASLWLRFDHMGDELKDYKYTLQHCNSDWQPSDLDDNEYIDGFTDDRISTVSSSFNTLAQYTHYALGLPNKNMRWTKSGNYLLKVFDYDDDRLVLVRRFMVAETEWSIQASFVRTVKVEKNDTWHEIDFSIALNGGRISLPQNEVKAIVLQNGRWDNAIGPLPPYLTLVDKLSFDYQDKIVFPAGKEYRFFDLRTFQFRGEGVKIITEKPDYYEVTLRTDDSRADRPVVYRVDANGRFFIQNLDVNRSYLECDYANVLFSIRQNAPLEDADVYVFGELSDWQLLPEFKMEYSHEAQMYLCEPFLKQGIYNYEYVVLDHQTGTLDLDGFEGNWYETGNQYTILTYFRPFGARYDRLMGTASLNSARGF